MDSGHDERLVALAETVGESHAEASRQNSDTMVQDEETNDGPLEKAEPIGLSPTEPSMMALERKLKSLEDLLVCPVCLEKFTDPKSLTCLHALCEKCIKCMIEAEKAGRAGRSSSGDTMITCPTCRQRSAIPSSDPANLQDNFMVKNMLEALTNTSPEPIASVTVLPKSVSPNTCSPLSPFLPFDHLAKLGKLECGNCGDEKDVVDLCQDCNTRLCTLCSTVHRKQLTSRSHTVVALDSLSMGETFTLRSRPPWCEEHTNEPQQFYCKTCEKMICRNCGLYDHRLHDFIPVGKYAEEEREILQDRVTKLEALAPRLPTSLAYVQQCIQTLQDDSVAVRTKAAEYIDKHIAALLERKRALLREVLKQVNNRLLGYQNEEQTLQDQHAFASELLSLYKKVNVMNSPWDQFALTEELTNCIAQTEALLESCTAQEDNHSPTAELDFDSSTSSELALRWESGAVVGRGSGKLKTEASRYVLDAPDTSHTSWTTKVYIVDTKPADCGARFSPDSSHETNFTATVEMDGQEDETVPVQDHQDGTYTIQLNVANPGQLKVRVLCNGQEIRASPATITVWKLGHTLRLFGTRGNENCQFKDPYDLTVAGHNNHLYVCDTGNHRVLELTENGDHVQTIKYTGPDGKAMKPTAAVVTPDGKLIVADYNHKSLVVFDAGEFVKAVQPPDAKGRRSRDREAGSRVTRPLECYGLAVNSDGQILATDYVERSLLLFSADVEYQSSISCRCQLSGDADAPQPTSPKGPLGVHADENSGQHILADFGYYRITVLDQAGKVANLHGSRLDVDRDTDSYPLKRPWGLWHDEQTDEILVSDHTSNSLQVFSSTGTLKSKFPLPDDKAPRLNGPVGMAADKFGRVWVAEREANRVRLL